MLPFNRSWIHQLDRGRVTVRRSSGTIMPYLVAQRCRTVLKGSTYGLFCRPKVPCDTQRRHLRLILSPKGAVRHSKAALTAYSVAQRCRATLKGGTYGDFSSPESTATNYPVSRTRRSAHETTSEDPSVSRTRRFAHETASEDPFVSRTHRLAHENDSEDSPVSKMRRLAHETTLADLFVSRMRLFTHETTSEDPSVSRTRRFTHETDLGRPFREQNAPSRSRDNLGRHSVSRTRRFTHETTSADPSVSRSRRLAHETSSADPPVSRTRRLAHETTLEPPCATGTLRELYENSTGAPRCRRGETRASATHRETWCLSGR